jgi:hypothetical protein
MEQSSSTSIALQNLTSENDTTRNRHTTLTREHDPILQASRLGDNEAPDGGHGWVVVAGCATLAWWMIGTPYSWGVIQTVLIEEGVSNPSVLSFVGSLAAALFASLAIVNSRVMRLLGAQKTAALGILLLGLSSLLSSFVYTHVGALFCTSGIIMGLGIG